jgi:hypothetical protein
LGEPGPDDPAQVGPYRIEAKIGEGVVYLGRGADGRSVAVKVFRPGPADDGAFFARFDDECRGAERVASFCTARMLDHGQDQGLAYMVTEYIEGPSLLRYVGENGPLSPDMQRGVAVGVAAALAAIHSAGLVHRDLKPSNVLLSGSGPRVTGFYVAPDRISGRRVTPAADIFGWGRLVAYVANGRALDGEPDPGILTEPLAGLVRAALSDDPEARPTSRDLLLTLVGDTTDAAVVTALGESLTSERETSADASGRGDWVSVPPPPMPPPWVSEAPPEPSASRRTWRKGLLVAVAGLGMAALVSGGTYLVAGLGDEPAAGTPAQGAAQPEEPPNQPVLVRIDTRPGWPRECHGDIGTYTPGQAAPVTLVRGGTCDMLPERSPADRNKVAFTRRDGDRTEAWVMNADGSGARRVTDRLTGGRVTWSPDGTRLAFMGRDGGTTQIFTIATGPPAGEPRRLTGDPAAKDDPMWSSTGRLAFWSRRDGVEQIYTLDPRDPGAPLTRLSRDGVRAVDPEWSPDGTKIAYTRGGYPNGDVWVMNADGSRARRLTASGEHEMDATWSPDGKWIGYVRGPYERPSIRTVRLDGTGDRPLGPPSGAIAHPNWS